MKIATIFIALALALALSYAWADPDSMPVDPPKKENGGSGKVHTNSDQADSTFLGSTNGVAPIG